MGEKKKCKGVLLKTRKGKDLQKLNPKQLVTGSHIVIITLNINGLNAPTKKHRLAKWMKTCACVHFHTYYFSDLKKKFE